MEREIIRKIIIEGQEFVNEIPLIKRPFFFEKNGNYVFVGIRQAGKSYLLYQRIQQLIEEGHSIEEMVYINFDDERLRQFTTHDFDLILQAYASMFNLRPILFFDEIQNIEGWENFDVFSINCYAVDPTSAIQNIVDLGVDLPVMIGEFHFGALDAGLPATGLEGVLSQRDRGIAYRHYCEKAAAHPNGVGCHYFQCYDQFVLGRFDGENYNIGLFDICSQPYPDMMEQIKLCSSEIYEVADGQKEPCEEKADSIPMIAY